MGCYLSDLYYYYYFLEFHSHLGRTGDVGDGLRQAVLADQKVFHSVSSSDNVSFAFIFFFFSFAENFSQWLDFLIMRVKTKHFSFKFGSLK